VALKGQKELYPDEAPEMMVFKTAEIEELVPDAFDCPVAPDSDMIESVRNYGILQPIILIRKKTGNKYDLAAGRRRIASAKETDKEYIPARIFPFGWSKKDAISLVENHCRRRNPVTDWRAVNGLLDQGLTDKQILEQTGMKKKRLLELLAINKLPKVLKDAFDQGEIKPGVVMLMSQQRKDVRKRLGEHYKQNGKVTVENVHELRREVKEAVIAALPASLFETPQIGWKELLMFRLIDAKKEAAKSGAPQDIIARLDELMKEIDDIRPLAATA
jgi:ParB/RepB/Spo0J family partition protein